ncbi:mRNA-decapping enzyme subunit 2 [Candida albicans P57072]|nr:mRNA-decapping enzyme subunit 2 [Candida albicans P57072]
MSIQLRNGLANQTLDRVLEDLLVRFVVNVPEEDLSSIERIMFQIEEAQWFYADFVRQLNPDLQSMKMKTFSTKILEKCPLIWKWGDPQEALSKFGKYKSTIPVRGVALFNKDLNKVVLVKGTESNSWSFPRGKISKDESDIDCAVREVEEETGFNCRHLIDENDCIERNIRGKNYKIYLVKNVPEDTLFEAPTYEISQIKWFDIKTIQKKCKTNPNTFFIVGTILKPMTKWINKNKGVLNEEEIMLQVELKLKELLGLNAKEPEENVDAGRELLNILQKVGQKESQSAISPSSSYQNNDQQPQPPMVNVPVPQHLHNQIPFFAGAHAAFPFYNQPFFNPMSFMPPQFMPHHPAYVSPHNQQPPNPQSFQKPKTNSKELLSILTAKSDKKRDDENSKQRKPVEDDNIRSRAQQLLSVFPKKHIKETNTSAESEVENENELAKKHLLKSLRRSATPEAGTTETRSPGMSPIIDNSYQEPSNEIEESIRAQRQQVPVTSRRKIKLLKRFDNEASANLLELLGPKKTESVDTANKNPDAGNELLGLLHKKQEQNQESLPNVERSSTRKEESQNTSNELLTMLKKPTAAKESTSESRSQNLLNLLKKPESQNAPGSKGKDQASGDQLADTHLPSYTQNNLQPQLSNLNPLPSPMNFLSSPEQKPQQASQVSSANQLLGLLHKNGTERNKSITSPNELWGTSTPGSTGGPSVGEANKHSNATTGGPFRSNVLSPNLDIWTNDTKTSSLSGSQFQIPEPSRRNSQLLDLLNTNRDPVQDAQYSQSNSNNYNNGGIEIARRDSPSDKFENFEDFKDYNDGYQFNDELLDKTYRNFDIASDEEDVDYLIDPLITHNDKSSHQDNEIKPSSVDNQNDQPKKIRILKPGENIDNLFGSQGSNEPGKGLLALLNGGKAQ